MYLMEFSYSFISYGSSFQTSRMELITNFPKVTPLKSEKSARFVSVSISAPSLLTTRYPFAFNKNSYLFALSFSQILSVKFTQTAFGNAFGVGVSQHHNYVINVILSVFVTLAATVWGSFSNIVLNYMNNICDVQIGWNFQCDFIFISENRKQFRVSLCEKHVSEYFVEMSFFSSAIFVFFFYIVGVWFDFDFQYYWHSVWYL